jgi:hypothetical protein
MVACWVAASPVGSLACSPANLNSGKSQTIETAREAFRSAAAVVDAEVIDAGDGAGNGVVLQAMRAWKGPAQQVYFVQTLNSCDIGYWEKGSRLRLVLTGGPNIYTASQRNNGVQAGDRAVFNAELDRLIGSHRPRDFRQPNAQYVR